MYLMPPTATDVEVLLKGASFWPENASKQLLAQHQAAIGAQAAWAAWEQATGWRPFLAGENPTSRPFSGTGFDGVLSLGAACVQIVSVTSEGRPLLSGTGFWPWDIGREEIAFEPPYTHLLLQTPHIYAVKPGGIQVTARWGYCETVPADVWQQCQQYAGLIALTGVENLQSVASIGLDGFNKAFDIVGIITQKDLLTTWGKDFHAAAAGYARVAGA